MGQAFDHEGGVLGEASGETKRDVFDKLMKEHLDAHEIRIKSMEEKAAAVKDPRAATTAPLDVLDPLLQFFQYEHLPPQVWMISRPFGELATNLVKMLPRNPERTVALRKLLEAKDCAVRAVLFK
jgi:hypothetical protein